MPKYISSIVSSIIILICIVAILEQAFACGTSYRKYQRRNHHHTPSKRHRRNMEENSISDFHSNDLNNLKSSNTSCGDFLCETSNDYPQEKISRGLRKIQEILVANDPKLAEKKQKIRPDLLSFLESSHSKHKTEDDYQNLTECEKQLSNVRPLEGSDSKRDKVYYIVNTPFFRQVVKTRQCVSENPCAPGIQQCTQVYLQKEFLVVPKKEGNIHIHDYQIKSLPVPGGCLCF